MRLRLVYFCFLALALLAMPGSAFAKGYENFRSQLTALTPSVSGLQLTVVRGDEALRLHNKTGRMVVVEGYDGEPYLRFKPDGTVEANQRSAATYINADRYGLQKVPQNALPGAKPRWKQVGADGSYTWFDHRIHLTAARPPARFTRQKKATKIFDWQVPLAVGGTPVRAKGSLIWDPSGNSGGFPFWILAPIAFALLAGLALLLLRRRKLPSFQRSKHERADEAW
jgi:hypothetical protein